ncbi:MAG: hypothetical protein ACP5HK_05005 [Acidilobus sp.]
MNWADVAGLLMRLPYHVDLLIYKRDVPSPREYCMEPSWGRPRGQVRNWRVTLPDGSCLHVLEYRSLYVVHRDRANLNESVVRHVALDEPSLALLSFWLPFLELIRVMARTLYRKRLALRGDPCAYNSGRLASPAGEGGVTGKGSGLYTEGHIRKGQEVRR